MTLTNELRKQLMEHFEKDPQKVIDELKNQPELLKILLTSDQEAHKANQQLEQERNERVKYVQMNNNMQRELAEQSAKLKVSQGALIGLGLIWLLSALSKK
ncbi:hypothetical protein JXA48_02055 [Candidatus Woesearchaeota archaeon]|nr:hypothetical protein [Candidatus Woesearchaeota archaeon]